MPKYLLQVSYTADGLKGVAKEGGSARREAASRLAESLGGKVEFFYYAFGETDVFVVADMPDHASMMAVAMAVGTSGAASTRTTVLVAPAEIDAAVKKTPQYRPPGQ